MRKQSLVALAALAASTLAVPALFTPVWAAAPTPPAATAPATPGAKHQHRQNRYIRLLAPLNLSQDQKDAIKPILKDAREQMKDLRQNQTLTPQDRRTRLRDLMKDTLAKIKTHLTRDQVDQLDQEIKAMRNHRGHHHGQGAEQGTAENVHADGATTDGA